MFRVVAYVAVLMCGLKLDAATEYYWNELPVGRSETAQLLTLFCRGCGAGAEEGHDIPLVAVLRDTLGQESVAEHRITAVWLLTYSHPTWGQRALAGIPFFYWNLSNGSARVAKKDVSPLLDLSAPQHPAIANVERQLIQWAALDDIGLPVRATTRAYRTNELDHERLHLEEANTYLLRAPVRGRADELTPLERDFVMARLELRKKLLGGFVKASRVASLGREASFEQERVRSRNWELLRQWAEKTGLVFEPFRLAGSDENYGMLWYPMRATLEPGGSNLRSVWKLLNIKDPYEDERLTHWQGFTTTLAVTLRNGVIPPMGESVEGAIKLIPLGVYSLSYPRQPLLLVDFRDKLNLRRHDLTRKAIDQITSGVIGVSHFTNWYYFVAGDAYNFVQERRGHATNRAERLDSYSEFRVLLALDRSLDPGLRQEMDKRAGNLVSNPMESSPENEMKAALNRYSLLEADALGDGGRLQHSLDNQRREELAAFLATPQRRALDGVFHSLTRGKYTHRAAKDGDNLITLGVYRRVEHDLEFLGSLAEAGTPPEAAYQEIQLTALVNELANLTPQIVSPAIRQRTSGLLQQIMDITASSELRAQCLEAIHKLSLERGPGVLVLPKLLVSPMVKPLVEKH